MLLAISADHRGYNLKRYLINATHEGVHSLTWEDFGTDSDERTDYPLFVEPVVNAIINGNADYGILICGSGVGMSIVANRHQGVRAALAWNKSVAQQAKEHDNANILVLPADYITDEEALEMVAAWLNARFREGRYAARLAMFD